MADGHHATCEQAGGTYVAKIGGREVAKSQRAVVLREENAGKSYPPVIYFPRDDVAMELFTRTDKSTTCPIKGAASYFSFTKGGEAGGDVAWSYETPIDGVAAIREHIAFYPDRVDVTGAA